MREEKKHSPVYGSRDSAQELGRTGRPCPENQYLLDHAALLMESHRRVTGRELISNLSADPQEAARQLWDAPCFVSSHDGGADPVLNYGNRTALELFDMDWDEFTRTPSRFTAEPENREERARMLQRAALQGYIDDYSGIRISQSGRRFRIENATIWNLVDEHGVSHGQAATFDRWVPLDG